MKRADVVAAGEDAAQRTHELALAIHDAEFPGVDNDAPHDAFSELAAQLDIQADRIGDNAGAPEDPGGLVTYFQVLNGTVAEASNAIFATLERLEELGYRDPIQANDACRQFTLEGILGK